MNPLLKRVFFALALIPTAALAEGTEPVDSTVVTASRLDQPAESLTQTIEVITTDDIEKLWAASATEVLRQVPGTNVIQQGGRGGVSNILLRGGEANFTVVLIDGVQVNDSTNTRGGSYDIGSLEQAQIGRVELTQGPMSPVYGSDALSGVVNFISRDASAGSSISVEGGTQGYGSASAFYGGDLGNINSGVGVWATNDDGDVEGADFESIGLNGKFSTAFADSGTVGLSLGYQEIESTSFPEDSGGPELAVWRALDERDIEEGRVGLNVDYVIADSWRTNVFASYYSREEDFVSPGIFPGDQVPPNGADTDFDRKQVLASVATDFGAHVTALLGAEWQNENGASEGYLELDFGGGPVPVPTDFELDRDTLSAFGELSAELGSFVLQGALRVDDPDEIERETTGRVGVLYKLPNEQTDIRANWGTGFKAPSFFALAHPLVGNPDLKSETGESVDLSVQHRFQSYAAELEFAVFRNEYEDLIDFDDLCFCNVNRDDAVTKGAEASGQVSPLENLNLRAHLTYLDTDIKGVNEELRGRPDWRGGLIVDWEIIADWRWVTSALYSDDFWESSIPTGDILLDSYWRVDTSLSWQATDALRVGLAIDNVLDADYEEAVGFPAAGIRGRLGLKYNF
ncbi:MAG: TonB-dependent receptor plug domain-containing protein [Gammaproteobacteria bacterium]